MASILKKKRKKKDLSFKILSYEAERDKCETIWCNHQVRRKEFTDETEEMMTWLKDMPKNAGLSFQMFQSRKETEVKSSQEEIFRKNANIEHLYKELWQLPGELHILRIRMEPMESMINEPGIFGVKNTPRN